ncbi:MAG TPA: radical SAM family heme chaperone HemW [Steroidobacteraceae bacterium]
MTALTLPPLALYVHFPWCVRKCPYCDFNSHTLHGELPEALYVDALLRDLGVQAADAQGREVASVFFGGGTPSLFAPAAVARLLGALRSELLFAPDAEITLEANPGTIERGRFADYRAAGINRVSLGAQSFDDRALQQLGRIHAAADTQRAVAELRSAGIDNFNLDLMYGLPQQNVAGALADIDHALRLEPAHISHYELTLEPGTVFGGLPPDGLPDADSALQMQIDCQQRLAQAGFAQYEVSAYARQGRQCRHNLNYWRFGDYLGIGAGAHGKCSRVQGGVLNVERSWREREPRRYLSSVPSSPARRTVASSELPFEYLMNTLRLLEGFDEREFEQRTGLASSVLQAPLARLRARDLVEQNAGRWRASALGFNFLNDVVSEFLVPQR